MNTLLSQLLSNGIIYRNNLSAWVFAPLIVPNPGPERRRFTVYLRPTNHHTIQHYFPMPNLENKFLKLKRS